MSATPPYIRVRNLAGSYDLAKQFSFASKGMTDLYIVFFEIGFRMLGKKGKMALITPSSFLRSKAGTNLRKYIYNSRCLAKALDLGHFQPFNATTYTLVSVFENNRAHDSVEYFVFDEEKMTPVFQEHLRYEDIFVRGKMFFSKSENLRFLHEVEERFSRRGNRSVIIKNGFATLSDKVFIGNFDFSEGTIDVLKASTGKWQKCIFPYHQNGSPMRLEEFSRFRQAFEHLKKNKHILLKRGIENPNQWFLFGRTQAIKDVFVHKLAINTLIKNTRSIKLTAVEEGKGVYGGLYILSNHPESKIRQALVSDEFIEYLRLLKNYKSGGYYTFSSLELEKYLSYKLEKPPYGQLGLFENRTSKACNYFCSTTQCQSVLPTASKLSADTLSSVSSVVCQ